VQAERTGTLWLADWSDSEDADFRAAWAEAGLEARVLRSTPLGRTVGTRSHRLRSWPAYVGLAVRGLRDRRGTPLVAWQPLAGALAGLLRRGNGPPLVVLNPLLDETSGSALQRLVLAGVARADRVLMFSRGAVEAATRLGLEGARLDFVRLGVRARLAEPAPTGDYFLAAGREGRDWKTLARAARGLSVEVRVLGPSSVAPPLRALPQVGREAFLELLEGARALVVPLERADRMAGQLAVLDAMSVGRAVVATRALGTEDYVGPDTGVLVPRRDEEALREALRRVWEPGVAEGMGAAALAAARGPLSLARFVSDVDAVARRA
jgi:Glycosyl transferases group 1